MKQKFYLNYNEHYLKVDIVHLLSRVFQHNVFNIFLFSCHTAALFGWSEWEMGRIGSDQVKKPGLNLFTFLNPVSEIN